MLLKSALDGSLLTNEDKGLLSQDILMRVYKLAHNHDMDHLLRKGLVNNGVMQQYTDDFENNFVKAEIYATYRYERIRYELENLCDTLESAGVDFMPLKGAVLRRYYKEPWFRPSGDIDILVREKDLDRAIFVLKEAKYQYKGQSAHDVHFVSPNNTVVELHYTLIENTISNKALFVLQSVWDYAILLNDRKHHFVATDEFFYFYHIAHLAKHFARGGCGIRLITDLWIMDTVGGFNRTNCDALLQKGDLLTFANAVRKLSRVWFEDETADSVTNTMASFILSGGTFGSGENRISAQQQMKGGKVKYALSKIFIPYDSIKFHYPILKKYPILMPIMQVRRWGRIVFCGHFRRTVRELQYNQKISREQAENTAWMLREIGLK